jgi:hypothetical protein
MAQKRPLGNVDDDLYCLLIKTKKDEIFWICSVNGQGRINTAFGWETTLEKTTWNTWT